MPTIKALTRSDSFALDCELLDWQQNLATPTIYNDGSDLPTLTIEIAKAPLAEGSLSLLYVAQPVFLTGSNISLTIPDEMELAVLFGAMSDLLGSDGESHDPQRAEFCENMYQIIVDLTNALLEGAPDNG